MKKKKPKSFNEDLGSLKKGQQVYEHWSSESSHVQLQMSNHIIK